MNCNESKLTVSTTHQLLAVKNTQEYILLSSFCFCSFFDQTESCNLLFKLLSNSLASKMVLFDSGNPGKVTGIKKIDGMSQEDFKLY